MSTGKDVNACTDCGTVQVDRTRPMNGFVERIANGRDCIYLFLSSGPKRPLTVSFRASQTGKAMTTGGHRLQGTSCSGSVAAMRIVTGLSQTHPSDGCLGSDIGRWAPVLELLLQYGTLLGSEILNRYLSEVAPRRIDGVRIV